MKKTSVHNSNDKFFVAVYQCGYYILGIGHANNGSEAIRNALEEAEFNGCDIHGFTEHTIGRESNSIHGELYWAWLTEDTYNAIHSGVACSSYDIDDDYMLVLTQSTAGTSPSYT